MDMLNKKLISEKYCIKEAISIIHSYLCIIGWTGVLGGMHATLQIPLSLTYQRAGASLCVYHFHHSWRTSRHHLNMSD